MSVTLSKRDPKLDEGVWAKYQGSKFKIAHVSNLRFQRMMARLQAPHRKAIEKGNMDPGESKDIVCEALAETVLRDWGDVVDSSKTAIPYDSAIGKTALLNDEGLREFVQEYATDLANFRNEEIEEKGND